VAKARSFAVAAAVSIRADYDAARLRALAKQSADADQTRRLLALAVIYDGGSRREAAKVGGVGLQTVRDWVLAFNAEGPSGLVDRKAPGKAPGKPPLLSDAPRQALARIVEAGPIPAAHGVVRWRLVDLIQWVFDEFGLSISKPTLSRELRALGFRKLSARPRHHAQDAEAVATVQKTLPPAWRRLPRAMRRASRSRSGSRTRRGSGRRTRSPDDGRGAAHAPQRRTTSARAPLTSSAPSARPAGPAPAPGSSCRSATPPP
jgi:transposase